MQIGTLIMHRDYFGGGIIIDILESKRGTSVKVYWPREGIFDSFLLPLYSSMEVISEDG